ncbi:2'-5' RNA ligase family protein [uncultured Ruegeria sp.]|uniref:2'-5' RNA ligase family protein n=1 Tax=uncultured Ruegeria sp. TaxID=259304 RepID=UPI0026091A23|nr:2'-5' RNA ligase family protein [uncultured Ruegeria sp.]
MKADVATYSVWMIPEEPDLTDLSNRVRDFADAYGTPSFVPHMTLMGDLAGEEAELVALLDRLSSGFSCHNLTVTGVKTEDLFFKSLYLDLSVPLALVREQAALAEGLPASQRPRDFQPHISIAYGPIKPEIKATETKDLKNLIGKTLRFRYLHLVKSSQKVPIEDWETLQSFGLKTY